MHDLKPELDIDAYRRYDWKRTNRWLTVHLSMQIIINEFGVNRFGEHGNCLVCSGSLPSSIMIVVGEHDKSAESNIRQYHDVENVFVHEAYNNQWLKNDVSLIKLKTIIDVNVNVTPVCAPKPLDLYANEKGQCSGWGTLTQGSLHVA